MNTTWTRVSLLALASLFLFEMADLGLANRAEAATRRYRSSRSRSYRGRSYSRGRSYGRYGRSSPAQRYRSNYNRQMQAYRAAVNRQMQAYRAALAKQQQFLATHRYVTAYRDFELVLSDGAKIRTMQTPTVYGADGKAKQPTAEELKKLHGDSKLVGFPMTREELQVGQWIHVTLGQQRLTGQEVKWVAAGTGTGQIAAIDSGKLIMRVPYQTWVELKKANQTQITKVPVNDGREARLVMVYKQGNSTLAGGKPAESSPFDGFGSSFGGSFPSK
ncbi:MAG: hypothetical protein AB7K24_01135 [Gemmataceae bacterium]